MIRKSIHKNIVDALSSHNRFEYTDFHLEIKRGSSGAEVVIQYTYDNKYYMSISIPSSTTKDKYDREDYRFTGTYSPGEVGYKENYAFWGVKYIHNNITAWLDNLWEELSTTPLVRNVHEEIENLNEFVNNNIGKIEDVLFTSEEIDQLRSKLDKLENELKIELEKAISDKDELKIEIEELHNDIDTLKQTVNTLKKPGWVKSFTTRAWKWSKNKDNRKALKDGYKIVREFLPEDIKAGLPEGDNLP